MTTRLQLRRSLAVSAAICTISAPAAGAAHHPSPADVRIDHGLRSPDTRNAATGAFGALTPVWPMPTPVPSSEPVTSRHDDRLPWLLGAGVGSLGCAVVIRHGVRRRQRVAA